MLMVLMVLLLLVSLGSKPRPAASQGRTCFQSPQPHKAPPPRTFLLLSKQGFLWWVYAVEARAQEGGYLTSPFSRGLPGDSQALSPPPALSLHLVPSNTSPAFVASVGKEGHRRLCCPVQRVKGSQRSRRTIPAPPTQVGSLSARGTNWVGARGAGLLLSGSLLSGSADGSYAFLTKRARDGHQASSPRTAGHMVVLPPCLPGDSRREQWPARTGVRGEIQVGGEWLQGTQPATGGETPRTAQEGWGKGRR